MKRDINLTTTYAFLLILDAFCATKLLFLATMKIQFIAGLDEHVVSTKGGCASIFFALTTVALETVHED